MTHSTVEYCFRCCFILKPTRYLGYHIVIFITALNLYLLVIVIVPSTHQLRYFTADAGYICIKTVVGSPQVSANILRNPFILQFIECSWPACRFHELAAVSFHTPHHFLCTSSSSGSFVTSNTSGSHHSTNSQICRTINSTGCSEYLPNVFAYAFWRFSLPLSRPEKHSTVGTIHTYTDGSDKIIPSTNLFSFPSGTYTKNSRSIQAK